MDEKTTQLITAMAEKLGTTAEYLWAVLIKQAAIAGITDLLVMAAWIIGAAWWGNFVRKQTTCPEATDTNRYPSAAWDDEGGVLLAWVSVFVVCLAGALVIGGRLTLVLAAFFNPEYWALKQIMP
jgi:hypothetical protein